METISPDKLIELLSAPLNHDRPVYRPPYDSPIEDTLAYPLVKHLSSNATFLPQYNVSTFCSTFRLDFYIAHADRRIGIECDGKGFHNLVHDIVRDTLILGSGVVDTIFRLKGKDVCYHTDDCLFLISRYAPQLFSERGLINLEALACPEVKSISTSSATPFVSIHQHISEDEDNDLNPWSIHFEARSLHSTNYLYFMFQEFWDIIRYKELRTFRSMLSTFANIPTLMDEHFEFLRSMSAEEYRDYKGRLDAMQQAFYGTLPN